MDLRFMHINPDEVIVRFKVDDLACIFCALMLCGDSGLAYSILKVLDSCYEK